MRFFRFFDAITTINDEGEFEKSFKEIYPPVFERRQKDTSYSLGSFLDLGIKIEHRKSMIRKMISYFQWLECYSLQVTFIQKCFYSTFEAHQTDHQTNCKC